MFFSVFSVSSVVKKLIIKIFYISFFSVFSVLSVVNFFIKYFFSVPFCVLCG